MPRQKRLVGGNNGLAKRERCFDNGLRHTIRPAQQFDNTINLRRLREGDGIIKPCNPFERDAAVPVLVARGNCGDDQRASTTRGQEGRICCKCANQSRADGSETDNADTKRVFHAIILFNLPLSDPRDPWQCIMQCLVCGIKKAAHIARRLSDALFILN